MIDHIKWYAKSNRQVSQPLKISNDPQNRPFYIEIP